MPHLMTRWQTAQLCKEAKREAAPIYLVAGFCNELSIGHDGWAMIVPLGDFPSTALIPDDNGQLKKQKAVQRYDAPALKKIVANFQNSKASKKYKSGLPIYVGHPDVPGMEARYPDKQPRGVFVELQARSNGLFGLPVFTNAGSDLVERKVYRALSGNAGNSEPDGEKEGLPVFRPTELFSVGLTNTPHLPVEFLNENLNPPDPQPTPIMETEKQFANAGTTLRLEAMKLQSTLKCDWDQAWNLAKGQHPELLAAMKQPTITDPNAAFAIKGNYHRVGDW